MNEKNLASAFHAIGAALGFPQWTPVPNRLPRSHGSVNKLPVQQQFRVVDEVECGL